MIPFQQLMVEALAQSAQLHRATRPATRVGPGVRNWHKGISRTVYTGGNYPGGFRRRRHRAAAKAA